MSIYEKHLESIPAKCRYKLKKRIDLENGGSELHLAEIAHSMVNWEAKLTTRLELTHPEVTAILSNNRDSAELQRRAALRAWKNKKGPYATYDALLKIFIDAGENDCAEVVCRVIGEELDHTDGLQASFKLSGLEDKKLKQESKFPYLNAPSLSKDEKDNLEARLRVKSKRTMDAFAILVTKTLMELQNNNVTVANLISVLRTSSARNGNKLTKKLKRASNLNKAFEKLHNYWSFFDYELLSLIINCFCSSMEQELDEYINIFSSYCQCRVCEVPVDSYSNRSSKADAEKNLHVKVDEIFVADIKRIKMCSVKELESRLSELLGTNLRLLDVRLGCIELIFATLHDLDELFPLSQKQEEAFRHVGVTRLFSEDQEYYNKDALFHAKPSTFELSSAIALEFSNILYKKEHRDSADYSRSPTLKATPATMKGYDEPKMDFSGVDELKIAHELELKEHIGQEYNILYKKEHRDSADCSRSPTLKATPATVKGYHEPKMDFSGVDELRAYKIALRLHELGEHIDQELSLELKNRFEEEFKNISVFSLAYENFHCITLNFLSSAQDHIHTGWEQAYLLYYGYSVVSQELKRQAMGSSEDRVESMSLIVRDLMHEIRLDEWVEKQGGWDNVDGPIRGEPLVQVSFTPGPKGTSVD